jgi:hypothetical protein
VYVPSSELGLPQPLSRKQVCPPSPDQSVGGTLACGEGGGGVPTPTTGEKALHSAYSVVPSFHDLLLCEMAFWPIRSCLLEVDLGSDLFLVVENSSRWA